MKSVLAALAALVCLPGTALAGAPEGTWLSEDGGTKVHISNCGGKLCGTVVWLDEPISPKTGKPKTDARNPDPAKRDRPLIGLRVVNGLTPDGSDIWSGEIYNADDGHTYQASMQVQDERTARVQGCVLKILCKNQIWSRAN
ncbi:MAG: DUF2147 domain-containing protein [Pseudolabrys sp.]|nr:DUF2147 domain-containing protein [Pseudolabrys sp.]